MTMTISMGDLYAPVSNNVVTTLTLDITSLSSTIAVVDASKFPSKGVLSIGYEVIRYTSIQNGNVFLGCTRGFGLNTVAAPHYAGDAVELRWVAEHHNTVSQAIVDIEATLGATVTGAYTTVGDRLVSFEATSGLTFPSNPRFGAMHYKLSTWYIYNGTTWTTVGSGGGGGSGDAFWTIQDSTLPAYVLPITATMAAVDKAAIFMDGSLRDALNSLTGLGALGRDGDYLSYKTGADQLVQVVESDRLAAPRIAGFGIDFPELNKISPMVTIPTGTRNISDIFVTVIGAQCSCSITLCRLVSGAVVSAYSAMYTIGTSVTSSLSSTVLVHDVLQDWNDDLYTITAGDTLFAKVSSITGSPDRVVVTVEAPYIPLTSSFDNDWQNTNNSGPEYVSNESGTEIQEVNNV